jgi:RNA polymerase sigma factor (sigma-70 family)
MEDQLLIWNLNRGSKDAVRRIFEKYESDMFTTALNLCGDWHMAQDAVQDVFLTFLGSNREFSIRKSLRGFLITCVVNCVRDVLRSKKTTTSVFQEGYRQPQNEPVEDAIQTEEQILLRNAMLQLPYEQREVILLRLRGGLRFRQIALSQKISITTAQSRYQYGLEKLRSILNGKV